MKAANPAKLLVISFIILKMIAPPVAPNYIAFA